MSMAVPGEEREHGAKKVFPNLVKDIHLVSRSSRHHKQDKRGLQARESYLVNEVPQG